MAEMSLTGNRRWALAWAATLLVGAAAGYARGAPPVEDTASKEESTDAQSAHGGRGRHFHDPKESAKRWDAPSRKKWQRPDEVVSLLDVKPGDRIADIGTGTGYFLPYLSKQTGPSGRVIGLDVEQAMVDYVAKRIETDGLVNVEVRKVPFDVPGLRHGEVDRILMVNTWHHIDDRAAYARLLYEALDSCDRPGAVLVIDYTLESRRGPPQKVRLDPDTVIAELKSGGFEATLLREKLLRQYAVRGIRKDRPAACPPPKR